VIKDSFVSFGQLIISAIGREIFSSNFPSFQNFRQHLSEFFVLSARNSGGA